MVICFHGAKQRLLATVAVGAAALMPLYSPIAQGQAVAPSPIVQSKTDYVAGEILVRLKAGPKSVVARAFIGKAVSEKGMILKQSWSGVNMHHFKIRSGQSVEDAIADLQQDPAVAYVEPNYMLHLQGVGTVEQVVSAEEFLARSSDPRNFNQVAPTNQEQAVSGQAPEAQSVEAQSSGGSVVSASSVNTTAQTSAPIELGQAWSAMSSGKTPSVVAVIDTGIDLKHYVFVNSGAIWINPNEIPANGIDDDKNGYIDDVNGWNFAYSTNSPQDDDGHGTHVSGIILGTTQDITASPLAAAKIRIMPLKFLDSTGSGSTSDAVSAIFYAANNGAKVLSNSWGGTGYSSALLDAITLTYTDGLVFVAAAGNSSTDNDTSPTYPASYTPPNVIAVAATDDSDNFASFSNWGAASVNLGSPGVSIWSTYPNNTFARLSGTSMATPFVSGTAALMVREQPSMNGYQLKNLLLAGVNSVPSLATITTTRGRLNVFNALSNAKNSSVSATLPAYSETSDRGPSSDSTSSSTGGCGLVAKSIYDSQKGDGDGGGFSGPAKNMAFFALLMVLIAPIVLSIGLRQSSGKYNRRHERYQIDSSVRVRFGDRELVGKVSTISLGGLQLNTDAWLEKGGAVTMKIRSPDGRDELEVEGKVVWSEEQKRYGVAFANANESVLTSIQKWTQSLLKA